MFIAAWPQARYCVMGAEQAAGTITEVRGASMKRKGESVDEAELLAFHKEVREKYERETDPLYAASRLWIDALIDPRETRRFLSVALECAAHRTDLEPLRTETFQLNYTKAIELVVLLRGGAPVGGGGGTSGRCESNAESRSRLAS